MTSFAKGDHHRSHVHSNVLPQWRSNEQKAVTERNKGAWADWKSSFRCVKSIGTSSWRSVKINDCQKEKKEAKRRCKLEFSLQNIHLIAGQLFDAFTLSISVMILLIYEDSAAQFLGLKQVLWTNLPTLLPCSNPHCLAFDLQLTTPLWAIYTIG